MSGWYLDCVTELGVIHGVHALLLCYYGNEAVTPLDLLGDVGGAGLRGDPRRLHDALQDDDHLQVAALQLHRRQVVQRAAEQTTRSWTAFVKHFSFYRLQHCEVN